MSVPSPLVAFASSSPIRSVVNAGFHLAARRRVRMATRSDPRKVQVATLRRLVGKAAATRFGRDHGFDAIRTVEEFQAAVPLRTYEDMWRLYFQDAYPVFENLTWPGRIPYFALTSGTTQGATKYIPVSREMVASNQSSALTMTAFYLASRPDSKLFLGRQFFLGGSTNLERPAPGVRQGDLSGIVSEALTDLLRPYTFPPLELALEADWDRKLAMLAERGRDERITMIGGVPSWLLMFFQELLKITGKSTVSEVWPSLELVVHGGVKFAPYRKAFQEAIGDPRVRLQETYPCSEGFIGFGDPETGLLRPVLDRGIFLEFVPLAELGSPSPARHWLGNARVGVNYAIIVSTCAGMWGHIIGDTIRFESLNPPLFTFTGRVKYSLSAFGEHLIGEEVEAATSAADEALGLALREWHMGPVFEGALGRHRLLVEFAKPPDVDTLGRYRERIDAELRRRNADYSAHRIEGVGIPLPDLVLVRPGAFESWMRSKGKLGGQHKVPRMDDSGKLAAELREFFQTSELILAEIPSRPIAR